MHKPTRGRLVRRFALNIFGIAKFGRLLERKKAPPGVKRRRGKVSEYGRQLEEKQKIRFAYGVSERQLRLDFERALRSEGVTGHVLLRRLETRLDNVVFRLGFARSRRQARQMVSHGHISLNGRRATIASMRVAVNDVVAASTETSARLLRMLRAAVVDVRVPEWLSFDESGDRGVVARLPERADTESLFDEQRVVEFYAR